MSIYQHDWRDVPQGYYADPKVRSRHDRKIRDERRFALFVENELGKMGYDRHDIPTASDVDRAEEIARNKF